MAIAIFLLTLTLVIWQPRGLGIGFSAVGGALLALATGVVTLQDVPTVWAIVWNATFTLVALVIISLILDEAGFFRWLALILARWGVGNGHLLFFLVILLGALVTALFTNDGTALIWTATVMELLLLLGFNPKATFAFVFATGFIADATSLPLPVSNLVNIIAADYFNISFLRYVLVMVPINFVAIASSLAVLWFYFDRHIPLTYDPACLPPPREVIRDPLVCQWSFAILGLLLIGYFFAEPLGVPVSCIAGIGALVMLALAGRWFHKDAIPIIPIRKILREAPWQVILFSLGMYLVVIGLRNAGITALLSQCLEFLSSWGLTLAATGTGVLATLLSGVMNNLPTVLLNSLAIQDVSGGDRILQEIMVYANIIGCNIGAKITPLGSLSTLLWLDVLARKGFRISAFQYIPIALILTIPVLFISLLSLAIWLPWIIA
ncbi:arsenic transporter [Microcoleus sp. FACHB-SPT15]|uniref:arsenic transporter n=1 Tax=Microcoleus sp. FACHB-SPT15 TaxID=2692830 RepID=UPI001783D9DF|nr:arsenic transporter [Microcoleus sp. FACHB-SPT15]MBD1805270.1 arsenic transporter [Microcoleus sp. FACHB-SPT15]